MGERERERLLYDAPPASSQPPPPSVPPQAPYHVAIDHVPDPSTDAVADAICDRARDVGAAAVVLPAHNRGALARFFVGSVTKAVIDRCPATVAVMRQ